LSQNGFIVHNNRTLLAGYLFSSEVELVALKL